MCQLLNAIKKADSKNNTNNEIVHASNTCPCMRMHTEGVVIKISKHILLNPVNAAEDTWHVLRSCSVILIAVQYTIVTHANAFLK